MISKTNKEEPKSVGSMINFLLYKWQQVVKLSALERVSHIDQLYILQRLSALGLNKDIFKTIAPSKRLRVIKDQIINILPGSDFIKIDYDPGMELGPQDFVELFINHECILMERVINLLRGKLSNE